MLRYAKVAEARATSVPYLQNNLEYTGILSRFVPSPFALQFDFIFNEHRDKVYSLCLRYLQHTQEAEDAMQEVFIKVFRKLDSFQDKAQLSTWIYRIAVNHCLDILRSKKRKQQLLRFLPFLQQEERFSYILTHKDLSLEDKQELDRLMQHIRSLPENQFTALVLNRLEGISIERVAQIMGLSYKSVESLLQRAKQNLIKRIEATSKE